MRTLARLVRRPEQRHAEMKKGIDEGVRLKDLGVIVEDVVPDLRDYHIAAASSITTEAHAIHRQDVIDSPEKFGHTTRRFQLGASSASNTSPRASAASPRSTRGDARLATRMAAKPVGRSETVEEPQSVFPLPRQAPAQHAVQHTGQPAATICAGSAGPPLAFQRGRLRRSERHTWRPFERRRRGVRTGQTLAKEIAMKVSRRTLLAGAGSSPPGRPQARRAQKGRAQHLQRTSAHRVSLDRGAGASLTASRSTTRWSRGSSIADSPAR